MLCFVNSKYTFSILLLKKCPLLIEKLPLFKNIKKLLCNKQVSFYWNPLKYFNLRYGVHVWTIVGKFSIWLTLWFALSNQNEMSHRPLKSAPFQHVPLLPSLVQVVSSYIQCAPSAAIYFCILPLDIIEHFRVAWSFPLNHYWRTCWKPEPNWSSLRICSCQRSRKRRDWRKDNKSVSNNHGCSRLQWVQVRGKSEYEMAEADPSPQKQTHFSSKNPHFLGHFGW